MRFYLVSFLPFFLFGLPLLFYFIKRRKITTTTETIAGWKGDETLGPDITYEPAGFWRRVAAWIIDSLILGLALQFPLQTILMHILSPEQMLKSLYFLGEFMSLVFMAYYVLFLSSRYQATLGKRLMRVYVISIRGQSRLTRIQAFKRFLAFLGPSVLMILVPIFMGPDFPMNLMPKPQHDMMKHMRDIQEKNAHGQLLNPEDQDFMRRFKENQPFTPAETDEMKKEMKEAVLSPSFLLFQFLNLIDILYGLMLAAAVAFTRQKRGIHDMLCRTRALKGRIS